MDTDKTLVIRPKSWKEAIDFFADSPQFMFRGQADAQWGLSTKLERICWQNSFPTTFLDNRESVMLREFQRRAHHYIKDSPALDNKLEWYALMQHFGGATRLLDFTDSFYIGAFFAMEAAGNDAAIWALNTGYLYQHTDNIIHQNETIYDLHTISREIVEENLCHNHSEKIIMAVEPERLNERISIQQGKFAIQGDLNYSFEENLAATLELSKHEITNLKNSLGKDYVEAESYLEQGVIKMVLPIDMHDLALRDLESMNISAATLFPGLEGFAMSLNSYLRVF